MTAQQYPVCVTVEGRPCLVVGGGAVAARKVGELCRCGASVTVISPEVSTAIDQLASEWGVAVERRPFVEADVEGFFLVVAATDDEAVNRAVARSAEEHRALLNVVDQPELCQFTAPAVLRRGPLTIAVSTGGASPALAGRVRDEIASALGQEWAAAVEAMGAFRERVIRETADDLEHRRRVLMRATRLDLARVIRDLGREGLEQQLDELLAGVDVFEAEAASAPRRLGKVFLVGAGPGDPELLTLKAARLLSEADAVVHDALVSDEILDHAPAGAEIHDVGKREGRHIVPQREISALLAELAGRRRCVVRLKGGDPYLFGRGAEEESFLLQRGIPVEVVPGVTSAVAVPAVTGIPLTHRDHASAVVIATGHRRGDTVCGGLDWCALGGLDATVSVLMGVRNLDQITEGLIAGGRSPSTPAALIQWGTTPRQREVVATLATLVERAKEAGLSAPAVLVVGDVVRHRTERGG